MLNILELKVKKSLVVALYLNLIDFLYLKSQHEIKIETIFFIYDTFLVLLWMKKKMFLQSFIKIKKFVISADARCGRYGKKKKKSYHNLLIFSGRITILFHVGF